MNEKSLNILKENSLNSIKHLESPRLNEETTTGDANSAFESMISSLVMKAAPKSIASSVCSVQPLISGPEGYVFGVNSAIDPITKELKLKVQRKRVYSNYNKRFRSDLTGEFQEDFENIFDTPVEDLFINLSAAESSAYVDSYVIPSIRNLSKPFMTPITLNSSPSEAYREITFSMSLALADINSKTKRGMHGFAIVSPTVAAVFASANIEANTKTAPDLKNVFKVSHNDLLQIFVDPLAPNDDIVVGYKSDIEGENALIFSPYIYSIYKTISAEDGDGVFFNHLRFGMSRNPLDNGTNSRDSDFLRLITVDASTLLGGNVVPSNITNFLVEDVYDSATPAPANTTALTTAGVGVNIRVLVNGIALSEDDFTFTTPNIVLKNALVGGEHVTIETFDLV